MKRASDKIKDFVEPQPFEAVQNFATDPARALAAYRFTDATSDLLARWLDALADLPRPPAKGGAARALAGLRGVGKSHALAVFAALAALPELRAKITDAHVATSARRLMNRRYTIVRVERGTRPTLIEEINDSLDRALGGAGGQWGASPAEMLAIAASRAPDATLIVIVDTAFGRERSVERNDGKILSELAAAAPAANCFVALALDDDIAGAEGVNAALVSAYQIDYLDPEHLFRVADQFVLKKTATARVGLHEIYMHLRGALPGFNWSEPRFSALYPTHPLIADVAAGVRLYAPAFAFLSFASEAATRASGRPAASLVLLDEVFDRAEYELRKAEDLKEAFAGYDELASAGVAQFPIMQRLEVKLTLKALFIISLDGRGATAEEICAALLFYDERNPSLPAERITQTLARLTEISNGALERMDDEGEARWRFAVSSSSAFDAALAVAVEKVRATADLDSLLNEAARARFADWPFASSVVTSEANDKAGAEGQTFERRTAADFYTLWRGTNRAGKMLFRAARDAGDAPASESLAGDSRYDWTLTVLEAKAEDGERKAEGEAGDDAASLLEIESDEAARPVNLIWRPATPTDEEMNNLLRLTALRSDAALVAEYGEAARAASVSLTAQAERIWTRIYLDEGALDVTSETNEGAAPRLLKWTEEARGAATLMSALTILLAPVFDRRFAEHPVFNEILGEAETARLIGDFFGGSNVNDAGAQRLARTFAVPLGLAVLRGDTCALDMGDASLKRAWIRDTLALTDAADGDVVPLEIIHRTLKRTPYGLSREAAQLVLSALVAGRRIELVTTDGDRISRRTLGRLLDWETIAGLSRAATILQSAEELTAWAYLLIGDESNANSIADETTRAEVRAALARWLDDWRERRLLESFEELPDAALTTRAFDMASAIRKTFLIAADSIESALTDEIPLEECLQRIADAFNNSPQNFARAGKQFAELTRFVALLAERERVRAYVSAAEPTGVPEIEAMRRRLFIITDNPHSLLESDAGADSRVSVAEFESLWSEFHERYLEHYAALHERAVGDGNGGGENETRAENLTRGDDWREAESLAELSLVKRERWEEIEEALNANRREQCELDVRAILGESPRCACAFRLSRAAEQARFTEDLEAAMQRSRTAYRRTLALLRNHLAHALTGLANSPETDSAIANKAKTLAGSFTETEVPARLTRADVELIERALETTGTLPPVRHKLSADIYGLLTRDELTARLEQWLNDIPEQSALVEVIRDEDAA